jgi:hypothetical protein
MTTTLVDVGVAAEIVPTSGARMLPKKPFIRTIGGYIGEISNR